MSHLDDGTLQAFLDDELPVRERSEAAEHLLGCEECRGVRDELVRAHAVVTEALSLLDTAAPSRAAPVRGRRRFGGGSLAKAAGLTLLLAAAASAAVPGSPVHEWIVRAVESGPEEAPNPVAEAPSPAPEPVPVGVSMIPTGVVEVVVTRSPGTTLRLVETDGASVGVSALGAEQDPVFRTGPGRIEVRDAVGGEVVVELPRSLAAARLVVDGQVFARKEAGELQLSVPGESVDGAIVWR